MLKQLRKYTKISFCLFQQEEIHYIEQQRRRVIEVSFDNLFIR